jgi:hypothetical protein
MNTYEDTEFIKCIDPRTGPAYFLKNFFNVQHPVRGQILLNLHDFQEELVDSYINNSLSINLISRQLGKSAVTAGYLLWEAMFSLDRTIVVGAHNFNGAREIIQRIRFGYDNCPSFLKPECNYYNKTGIEFTNGSRIMAQAVTENLGRGTAISTLYLDELAYAKDTNARNVWPALSPCFATGSRVIINSSAGDDDNFFAELWKNACQVKNGFVPLSIDWHRHPGRTQAWADDMIDLLGEARFRQEHENEFLINE